MVAAVVKLDRYLTDKKSGFILALQLLAIVFLSGLVWYYSKRIKKKGIVLIFFGDAAVETGVFFESLNFAILKKLQVIFVCENNFYSVYSNMKYRQPQNRKISRNGKRDRNKNSKKQWQ